jgi:hypothetical protein
MDCFKCSAVLYFYEEPPKQISTISVPIPHINGTGNLVLGSLSDPTPISAPVGKNKFKVLDEH